MEYFGEQQLSSLAIVSQLNGSLGFGCGILSQSTHLTTSEHSIAPVITPVSFPLQTNKVSSRIAQYLAPKNFKSILPSFSVLADGKRAVPTLSIHGNGVLALCNV